MAECSESLTTSFAPTCAAIKKPGGFKSYGYIGTISDLEEITRGITGITALSMAAGKKLIKFQTKDFQVDAPSPINPRSEGSGFVSYQHLVNLPIYFNTEAELEAAQTLIEVEKLFIVLATSSQSFRAYGICEIGYDFKDFGLMSNGGTDNSGKALGDVSRLDLIFSGTLPNAAGYVMDTDFATTKAMLEALLA